MHGSVPVTRNLFSDFNKDLKEKCPFGQVPLLVVQDDVSGATAHIVQSIAICEFLAKKAGLIPTSHVEQAIALQYVLGVDEFRTEVYSQYYSGKETQQAKKEWKEGKMKFFLDKFESFLVGNKKEDRDLFLVGSSISWADICLYDALVEQAFLLDEDNLWGNYPLLEKFMKQVENSSESFKQYVTSSSKPVLYMKNWRQ